MAKSDTVNFKLPSGFTELLPGEKRLENYLLDTIRQVYERYGFAPIETPAVERLEVLQAKGNQGDNIIYGVNPIVPADQVDNEDARSDNRGLKFDQTVPLAAYIARNRNNLVFPFARYQMDMVFRGERAKKGRYRQFRQCDIDVVGRNKLSLLYDAQMPAIINEIFSRLDIGNFLIRISNRKVLSGLIQSVGIAPEQVKFCISVVDALEKIGAKKVTAALLEEGISEAQAADLLKFTQLQGDATAILQELSAQADASELPDFKLGVSELTQVIQSIQRLGVPAERYCIDLAIARGLDYYTGTVYETTLLGYESLGSICSGGRYEELVGMFAGEKMPGVGLSIGLTRLMRCLVDAKLLEPLPPSPAQVMVVNLQSDFMDLYLEISQVLRQAGVNVLTSFSEKQTGKQIQQADKQGIPLCVFIGESEKAAGSCRLKNLKSGEQVEVQQSELVGAVQQQLELQR
ncbi:MAG: histidine--tRNA ligase [Cyanobacteria bacterium P01_H01_bin.15]